MKKFSRLLSVYISEFSQRKKNNPFAASLIRREETFTFPKSLIESLISLIASFRSKRLCKHTIKIGRNVREDIFL